jgi:RHH-type proline utilization regulon transcriptional repressor/proline dehydrogenase/delta 1-pyrroline-5-carboxylate dehydrogenase
MISTIHKNQPQRQNPGRNPVAETTAAPRVDRYNGLETMEPRIQQIGRRIFERAQAANPSIFHQEWWHERLLEWTMADPGLKVQLFRFIDVLPTLTTSVQVAEHLKEYLAGDHIRVLPGALEAALRFTSPRSVAARVTAVAARRNALNMARRFIAGADADQALATIQKLRRRQMAFTLDLLGEAVTADAQADEYMQRNLDLIDALTTASATWPIHKNIDVGPLGLVPRVNISLKLSSLDPHFDPIAPDRSFDVVASRLRLILTKARRTNAFINVDMESYAVKNLTLDIFERIMSEDEFRDTPHVGIVIQAYLKDALADLRRLIDFSQQRGTPFSVRLVKGAYWDHEIIIAIQEGWPIPVFTEKWRSDHNFEQCLDLLMKNHDRLHPAIASHNVRSIAAAIATAERYGLGDRDYELQMLFGMGDPIKSVLTEMGQRLRIYCPFGELIPGMAYLIRRLLENTSNDSFLRQSFSENLPIDALLADPNVARPASQPIPQSVRSDPDEDEPMIDFTNEPLTDFSIDANRQKYANALKAVRGELGRPYALWINGKARTTETSIVSVNPAKPGEVIGQVSQATVSDADDAVAAAKRAFAKWAATPAGERAGRLAQLAQRMRDRRFELCAWITLEVGKTWREADGDVAEAVDFCEYYAKQMTAFAEHPRRRHVPGEENTYVYQPRGVVAVIAPWNFPLAILTGMTAAALAAGNTVVIKPAEQSSVVAAKLMEMIHDADFPAGVVNFVPGLGETVGSHLVNHAEVNMIAFTGSRDVGLKIIESAGQTPAGRPFVKKVVAEMGGKNAIIIDADADLDEAVAGAAASAFGYGGQKCSACSRVIVVDSAYEPFVRRIVETAGSIPIGAPEDPANAVGPVIDAAALAKIRMYVEKGKAEAELLYEAQVGASAGSLRDGYFAGPVIFGDVSPEAAIAQEEIFGPVLAVIRAKDFEEALAIANSTDYALTGGIYSRSPAHLEQAKREFRVGNLYINRKITGALVDRQPFGGFRLSGIGSKAGGPDYLWQFCEPKTITEDTLRHGFAPTETTSVA